ncbi:MAG TPA: hypothetical protein IAD10_09425 [Candidatus Fimicola cottocaccae]|nr:hypothetical protein [Candidatus Fimicola cottocaccae]
MLIYINKNRKITGYNTIISKSESQKYLQENYCIWIDEEIDYTQSKEGYQTVMYLNENNTIRYEFEKPEIIEPEPTQLDIIQEQQLIIMTAQADQYEQNLENRLNDMEVQATLYEAILELGGNI